MTGLGRPEEGLAGIDQGFEMYQALKTPPVFWPHVLSLRATVFALGRRPADELFTERFCTPALVEARAVPNSLEA
jgi:hypothetical protein